jgi:hypothetical protein
MEKQRLQETLAELHESLTGVERLDQETRELVETVVDDLQRLVQQDGEVSSVEVQPVTHNLQELLLRFETEHPQLTGIINRIAGSLANLGI